MQNPRLSSGVVILASILAVATLAPAPATAVAAPAPPTPSGTKAASPRVANLAAAIRAEIKSKSGGGGAQLFKAYGIDPGAPARGGPVRRTPLNGVSLHGILDGS